MMLVHGALLHSSVGDAAYLVAFLSSVEAPFVLAGHSYCGSISSHPDGEKFNIGDLFEGLRELEDQQSSEADRELDVRELLIEEEDAVFSTFSRPVTSKEWTDGLL